MERYDQSQKVTPRLPGFGKKGIFPNNKYCAWLMSSQEKGCTFTIRVFLQHSTGNLQALYIEQVPINTLFGEQSLGATANVEAGEGIKRTTRTKRFHFLPLMFFALSASLSTITRANEIFGEKMGSRLNLESVAGPQVIVEMYFSTMWCGW